MRRIFIATLAVVITLPTPPHARYTISCSSNNYRYQYCGANTDGYARLLNQQSRAACVRGRTWGFDNGAVTLRNRSGSVERSYYSGEMANLPSGAFGINPAGSGILVNGMYFAR